MSAGAKAVAARPTAIEGLFILDLQLHGDNRGWFKEQWQRAKFRDLDLDAPGARALKEFEPVQQNISFNASPGVTRGLHAEPWDKLVSVAHGRVFGAWCDLREGSATYGQVFSHEIGPDVAVFVPRGVANGFQALEPNTAYNYLVNGHWSPQAAYSAANLADPTLDIQWPLPIGEISQKDIEHPLLVDATPVPNKRTLIIGTNGQLGRALRAALPDALAWDRQDWDLRDPLPEMDWTQVGVIVLAAAYTAVDQAEVDRAQCWQVNAEAVTKLVQVANEYQITLVYVSSEYVFDGTINCHSESEPLSPLSVYGQSKAAGELAVRGAKRHYIVRSSWVVGEGKNFVRTMRDLALRGVTPQVVGDQFGRLTFADDLAFGIVHLISQQADWGTYHLSNSGDVVSWAEVAREVFALCAKDPEAVQEVSSAQYFAQRSHAPRPRHSALDLSKIAATGFVPRDWRAGLEQYVRNLEATARKEA
ncbi:sugar nucleotide-binding protein [Corynebacterium pseudopelargi]|uniref:dTDP-4-dehydrorhamnose reductase n=1 Tax=Corynebacterium pseudopelargi TaxID=2080757 RepID=A0A3G6IX57_9CORY|nr:bifunctional dTDP-4-dehydrorhamnose 3,5-epimerase family protein/NAD(P)-dependent oxidoreductase [Corynebacterium pseudopelargi]AZA10153.1 putative dTDP-4-dehydrorhamnose 3,5-epimerase [Corynebacterium pseudopelargi]